MGFDRSVRASLLVGLFLLVLAGLVVALGDPFDFDDRPLIHQVLRLAAQSAQADIEADLQSRVSAQLQLARSAKGGESPSADWETTARLLLRRDHGYLSVVLLDRAFRVVRSAELGEADVPVLDLITHTEVGAVARSSSSWTAESAVSKVVTLQNGKLGCVILVPSFAGKELAGFVLAVLDVEKMLGHILSDQVALGYSVAVLQDGVQIYGTSGNHPEQRSSWSERSSIRFAPFPWQIEVWPDREMLSRFQSRLPEVEVLFALSLILVLASTIQFARATHANALCMRRARDELERRVQERTAELKNSNDLLRVELAERAQMEQSLRSLSAHLLHVQDEERRKIARELHDSTAQLWRAVQIDLARLLKLVPNDSRAQGIVHGSMQLAAQALSEVRTISYLLHPPILDDFGLQCALEDYVAGFSDRSGIQVNLEFTPELGRLDANVELALFRIVQEALGNIQCHSGSRTARISLFRTRSTVSLHVVDQGCGLPKDVLEREQGSTRPIGVGIAGMRERVRDLAGRVDITSDSHGTVINVVIPVAQNQSAHGHESLASAA